MSTNTEVKPAALADDNRCRHISSSGRQCKMPRGSRSSAYCTPHSQLEQQCLNAEKAAQELLGNVGSFQSVIAVNEVLGKLFRLTAENRIPIRNAAVLAYIGQLLLQSTEEVGYEIYKVEGSSGKENMIRQALALLNAES